MCGIVGYLGPRPPVGILLEGLRRLEYRGYDSAGIAVILHGRTKIERVVGKVAVLEETLRRQGMLTLELPGPPTVGIGHTRWATHGRPSEANAHPHRAGPIAVVHNGIIENFLDLKKKLRGRRFRSETDTEILAHLIDHETKNAPNLEAAVRAALKQVRGSYAICVISEGEPQTLIAAKDGCPLVVGAHRLNNGRPETFIASDITAILPWTREIMVLEDGEMAVVPRAAGATRWALKDRDGLEVSRQPVRVTWDAAMAEKGGYPHFMLKEIHEQPQAVRDTMAGRCSPATGEVHLAPGLTAAAARRASRVILVACGTSWHAALIGKYLIEGLARLPVEAEIGSEFRYRDPVLRPTDLVVAISQSGETADTLAAVREAKGKGAKVIGICNVVGSSLARQADTVLATHAGPEIGVASTKTFTAQLTALYLLAVGLGRDRRALSRAAAQSLLKELVRLPDQMARTITGGAKQVEVLAKRYDTYGTGHDTQTRDFLYLGRGIQYPIALEGALKLKELSYIHAEGYPAGEMKHGPIALIDQQMPVVVLIPQDKTYEKVFSNIMEVKARGGRVLAVTTEGSEALASHVDDVLTVPASSPLLAPWLVVLPLQLLAYYLAVRRGNDVDRPRNLAKSVTVE